MATYKEIDELLAVNEPTGLRRRVAVGTMVAADAIRLEADSGTADSRQRKRFAQTIFRQGWGNPAQLRESDDAVLASSAVFEAVYRSVLIANISATKAQITGASDAAIQTAVNNAVALLALSFLDPAPAP
jgi:hypothetical protein